MANQPRHPDLSTAPEVDDIGLNPTWSCSRLGMAEPPRQHVGCRHAPAARMDWRLPSGLPAPLRPAIANRSSAITDNIGREIALLL